MKKRISFYDLNIQLVNDKNIVNLHYDAILNYMQILVGNVNTFSFKFQLLFNLSRSGSVEYFCRCIAIYTVEYCILHTIRAVHLSVANVEEVFLLLARLDPELQL